MAAYSGLERSYISRLEKGLRTPSLDVVFRFAKAFKISPQALVKEINLKMDRGIGGRGAKIRPSGRRGIR